MVRLQPGWLVVLFAAVIAVSGWLPWRTTTAHGGGHSNAIGGTVGNLLPLSRFDAGQLIVLLASILVVAGAMTARGLSARTSAAAALVLSVWIGALTVLYYHQRVHPPVDAAYGLYIGAVATVAAAICSIWALFSALVSARTAP
ncbi:MAG: hypothetical protein JO280_13350 [Mycobacteriaceae bacterium]|nr:hypothetical protein [Mycobacteriaceae bacterium]